MEYINVKDLKIFDLCGYGSFAKVFKCEYNEKKYAFKKFDRESNILSQRRERKIIELSHINFEKSILPCYIVKDGNYSVGYLSELAENGDIGLITDYQEKIDALRSVKESILELNRNKVIHTDIHNGNILKLENDYFLTDFDNSAYRMFHSSRKYLSDYALDFVKKIGMSKDLDIFLFNLLTFSELSGIDYNLSRLNIMSGNYVVFKSKEAKSICDSLLLKEKTFNNTFLIDTVEDVDRKKSYL